MDWVGTEATANGGGVERDSQTMPFWSALFILGVRPKDDAGCAGCLVSNVVAFCSHLAPSMLSEYAKEADNFEPKRNLFHVLVVFSRLGNRFVCLLIFRGLK